MILSQETIETFAKHVVAEYPKEAVGVIINDKYIACKNVHDNPTEQFRLDAKEALNIEISENSKIQAVMHSHPYDAKTGNEFRRNMYDPAWPSVVDQQAWMLDNIPWGIVATDGTGISEINWLEDEIQPFELRKFAWFTADCYSLVRDWHRINSNVTLPNLPREHNFWKKGINTIEEGILQMPNVTKHPYEHAQIGDVAVFCFEGNIVCHLGVISGQNEMMHQWVDRYVETGRWDQWSRRCKYVLRVNK